jgi:class 3 adenylate cyclase
MTRVGTATVLFTDLVASTELRSVLGEVTADRLALDHERLLRDVVAAHNGVAVGDVTFADGDCYGRPVVRPPL